MSPELPPGRTLDSLKKEAKRWLKALRENVDDARARLERALPTAPQLPGLRDVQHALARELGFPGWAALKEKLAGDTRGERRATRPVEWFLDNAVTDHHVRGGPAHVQADHTAMRVLERYPEVAHENFYTDVVCGNLDRVRAGTGRQARARDGKANGRGARSHTAAQRRRQAAKGSRAQAMGAAVYFSRSHGFRSLRPMTTPLPLHANFSTAVRIRTCSSWRATAGIRLSLAWSARGRKTGCRTRIATRSRDCCSIAAPTRTTSRSSTTFTFTGRSSGS